MKLLTAIFCFILLLSCNNDNIVIKGFRDSKANNDSLRNCFYADSNEQIKEQLVFFTGLDAYATVIINDSKNVLSPNYERAINTDNEYSYINKYANDKYQMLLKLNKISEHFYKGVLEIKGRKGGTITRKIAGSFN